MSFAVISTLLSCSVPGSCHFPSISGIFTLQQLSNIRDPIKSPESTTSTQVVPPGPAPPLAAPEGTTVQTPPITVATASNANQAPAPTDVANPGAVSPPNAGGPTEVDTAAVTAAPIMNTPPFVPPVTSETAGVAATTAPAAAPPVDVGPTVQTGDPPPNVPPPGPVPAPVISGTSTSTGDPALNIVAGAASEVPPPSGTADTTTSNTALTGASASAPTPVTTGTPSNTGNPAPNTPAIVPTPVAPDITGALAFGTALGLAATVNVGTAAIHTSDASLSIPPSAPAPAPIVTSPTLGTGTTSGSAAVLPTASGSFPPTVSAKTLIASTQLSTDVNTATATAVVPTCTIRWPSSSKKTSSNTESICDAIGLPNSDAASALIQKLELFWDNGSVITYSFIGGTTEQQSKFSRNISPWTDFINCRFVQVAQGGTIRISFDPNAGSWSYVGRAALDAPSSEATVNTVITGDPGFTSTETAINEHLFCHMLGMMHEHPGPTSGGPVTLDEAAVYSCYQQSLGWDVQTTKTQIIDVYNSQSVSNYATVNVASKMRYPVPAALTLQQTDVPMTDSGIPMMDLAYLMINYPVSSLPSNFLPLDTYFAQFVDAETAQSMTNALAQGNLTKMRAIFHAYLLSGRLAARAGPSSPAADVTTAAAGADPDTSEDTWCIEILPTDTSSSEVSSDVQRGIVVQQQLWRPYEEVTFGFMDGTGDNEPTEYRKIRVRQTLADYNQYISLDFQEKNIQHWNFRDENNRKACQIRFAFGRQSERAKEGTLINGLAVVGRAHFDRYNDPKNPGPPYCTCWLGVQPKDSNDEQQFSSGAMEKANRVLWHEIGHILGMRHEHQSPNAPIDPDEKIERIVGAWLVTQFDPDSVMLYSQIRYKPDLGGKTKYNLYPSRTDFALLSLLYPYNASPTGTFAQALHAFGFPQKDITQLLNKATVAIGNGKNLDLFGFKAVLDEISRYMFAHPKVVVGPATLLDGISAPRAPLNAPVLPLTRAAVGPPANLNPPAPGFLNELVTNLKQFFRPGGNQMFTLQFPGRFLDQASYAWDTASAGIYGQFIKPTAVNEAEFRLVDQLYDVAPNVGGPNGTNLSIVYEQLLNNLLPKHVDHGLAQQQDQIRDWLIKDVPMTPWITDIMARQQLREQSLVQAIATSTNTTTSTTDAGGTNTPSAGMMFGIASKTETLNRIELSELLMNEYLYAKQDWEVERDNLIMQATQPDVGSPEAQRALNDLTRRLAHITDTRQAQLAAKYADAVVRGYSHTIRQYLGYLDIASPAEALQDAKDLLREAAMSSLDGSMKIYPVQLTPLDWFAGLSTSFTMEDLTQNPELIRQQIRAKSQDLDTLTTQLVALQMGARGDPTELQNQVQAAQTALDKANSNLSQQYSNNVIEMAKTYLNSKQQLPSSKDAVAESVAAEIGITPDMLDDLMNGMAAVQTAQDMLTSSSRALSQLLAAQALAEATDTKQQQQQIILQIHSLNADLKELQTRWQVLTASTGGMNPPIDVDHSDQDVPTTPIVLPAESSSGGSRWQEISFKSTTGTRRQSAQSYSSSESTQWNCNIWFASASGGSSSSSGTSSNDADATTDTFELAMRVTLVTVDRGGWFQPQFFKESKTFYRVNEDLTWTNATAKTMPNILSGKETPTGLMPGYPTAFLVAKDIIVRITHDATATGNSKETDMESAAASGGILCFSYSNSSSRNSTATSSSFQSYANGFVVKIPGPQILGYMVQVAEPDQTTLMPATLPENFFIPDDVYKKVVEDEDGPDHTPNPREPPKTVEPPAQTITQEKLREVLDQMLNDRIGEIFDRVNSGS